MNDFCAAPDLSFVAAPAGPGSKRTKIVVRPEAASTATVLPDY
jgi:hypothetical protein